MKGASAVQKVKQATAINIYTQLQIAALSTHLVAKDCHRGALAYRRTPQGLLLFAVTADEDSASNSQVEAKALWGELCEISDDMERPGLWTAEKSSSGVNPPDLKSCPPLG